MANEKLIALIPARGGSKRVPGKNILPFFGHPMLAYSIVAAKNSNLFERIIVSSDDPLTGEIAEWYGAEFFPRPPAFATDQASLEDVAFHVLDTLADEGLKVDAICQLMPNCPLKRSEDIVDHYQLFRDNQRKFQIAAIEYRGLYPHWAMTADQQGYGQWIFGEENLLDSHDIGTTYCPTGAIWWARAEDLRQHKSYYGDAFHIAPMDANRGLDIDDNQDLELAEILVRGLQDRDGYSPLESINISPFRKEGTNGLR